MNDLVVLFKQLVILFDHDSVLLGDFLVQKPHTAKFLKNEFANPAGSTLIIVGH